MRSTGWATPTGALNARTSMSKQQLRLHGSKRKQDDVSWLLIDACMKGRKSLSQALGITDAVRSDLRAQSFAFYRAGKWERCIDVVLGLVSLGNVEPWDPVMLSRCFDEIDDPERASACAKIAEIMLTDLDASMRTVIEERSAT